MYTSDEFAIDDETGVITVIGDLDEENIDQYILTIQAENDQATGVDPATVSVSVFDTDILMQIDIQL